MNEPSCFNCGSNNHQREGCPHACYMCHMTKDERSHHPTHDQDCTSIVNHLLPGFMRKEYDRQVCKYRDQKAFDSNGKDEDGPAEIAYINMLNSVGDNDDPAVFGLANRCPEIPDFFGNYNFVSLCRVYKLFVKKLERFEYMEYALPSLKIRRCVIQDSLGQASPRLELEFDSRDVGLRNQLMALGDTGVLFVTVYHRRELVPTPAIPERRTSTSTTSKKSKFGESRILNAGLNDSLENADLGSSNSTRRRKISSKSSSSSGYEVMTKDDYCNTLEEERILVSVYLRIPPITSSRSRLTISDIPSIVLPSDEQWSENSVNSEKGQSFTISFYQAAEKTAKAIGIIQNFALFNTFGGQNVFIPTFFRHLVRDFNSRLTPLVTSSTENEPHVSMAEIELFAEEINVQLSDDQRKAISVSLHSELSGVTGPTGTGKSLVVCFVALFTYFRLRQRVLIVAHRRTTAIQMLSKMIMFGENLIHGRKYTFTSINSGDKSRKQRLFRMVYSIEDRHRMQAVESRTQRYLVDENFSLENEGIVITTAKNVNSDAISGFFPTRVLFDDANRLPMFDLLEFFSKRTHLLRTVNRFDNRRIMFITLFGDLMQAPTSFHDKLDFVTDEIAVQTGLNLPSLTLLLKCKIPSVVLTRFYGGSQVLFEFVHQHYYSKFMQVDYTHASPDITNMFPKKPQGVPEDQIPSFVSVLDEGTFSSLVINFKHKYTPNSEAYEILSGNEYVNNRNATVGVQMIRVLTARMSCSQDSICVVVPYQAQANKYIRRLFSLKLDKVRVVVAKQAFGLKSRITIIDFVRTSDVGPFVGTPYNFPTVNENRLLLPALSSSTETRICMLNTKLPKQDQPAVNDVQWLAMAHRDHPSPLVRYIEHDN